MGEKEHVEIASEEVGKLQMLCARACSAELESLAVLDPVHVVPHVLDEPAAAGIFSINDGTSRGDEGCWIVRKVVGEA